MFESLNAWIATRVILGRDEEGQTSVEYAVVVALVAIALATALATTNIVNFGAFWSKVQSTLNFT